MQTNLTSTFVQAFLSDSEIADLLGDRSAEDPGIYAPSSLDGDPQPASPSVPWVAWREMPSQVRSEVSDTGNSRRRVFLLYVYDEAGSYDRIDSLLSAMRRVCKALDYFQCIDGTRCSHVEWAGFSGSLTDETYDRVVKFGTVYFDVNQ